MLTSGWNSLGSFEILQRKEAGAEGEGEGEGEGVDS